MGRRKRETWVHHVGRQERANMREHREDAAMSKLLLIGGVAFVCGVAGFWMIGWVGLVAGGLFGTYCVLKL